MTEKQILTTFEAADMCKVSYNTIKNWIKRDLLPAYRTAGGHLRIKCVEFEKFAKDYNIELYGDESFAKKRVLVVDNDDTLFKTFDETFSSVKDRVEVQTTSDPFEAAYLLCTKKPDIFIINSKMNGMDAGKVVDFIKTAPEYKDVKVAVVKGETGSDLSGAIQADFSISKPFDRIELMETISPLIKTKPGVRGRRRSR